MAGAAIATERLLLASPHADQAQATLDFAARNRLHLQRWSPPAPDGLYTLAHWLGVVEKSAVAAEAGSARRFWISPRAQPGLVIGSIGFSQIFRGPSCSCVLGYQIDSEFEGKGLMREALGAALGHMFEQHKMHRIAANYRPENIRSGRLLAALGFHIEGFAKNYLFIDGDWRDHILTSLTHHAFDPAWIRMG